MFYITIIERGEEEKGKKKLKQFEKRHLCKDDLQDHAISPPPTHTHTPFFPLPPTFNICNLYVYSTDKIISPRIVPFSSFTSFSRSFPNASLFLYQKHLTVLSSLLFFFFPSSLESFFKPPLSIIISIPLYEFTSTLSYLINFLLKFNIDQSVT